VIVQIGDFSDMLSLSKHKSNLDAEGVRYVEDIHATKAAMETLVKPWKKLKSYRPRMVLTLGNHEERIIREISEQPILLGAISIDDLGYKQAGWEVHKFLKVVKIDGWEYSHYFVSGAMGRPVTSAASLLRERQCSAVQGHVQYTDMAIHKKTGYIGIFAGICYLHDEDYLTPQGNSTRRQIVFLHQVANSQGDPMFVSLDFLKARYS